MDIRRRKLSPSERKKLSGFVSPWASVGRAVLFAIILFIVGALSRKANRASPDLLWWPVPVAAIAVALFIGARGLTGGRGLRKKIRDDLRQGEAEEKVCDLATVVAFPEIEDEGPVWVFHDAGRTYCLSGQRIGRLTTDGLPRRRVIVTAAPLSNLTLQMRSEGDKPVILISPTPFHQCPLVKDGIRGKPLAEIVVDWPGLLRFVKSRNPSGLDD